MRCAILSPVLVFGLLAAGCGVGRPIHYYTIVPPAAAVVPAKPDGLVLVMGRIETPEPLQDARILYRAGANEAGAYEYHRWIERPGMMAGDLLLRVLRNSGKFRQVLESGSTAAGDYLVRGKLEDFAEVDDGGIRTSVALHVELVDLKSGQTVWDRQYGGNEPVNGKDMKDVVQSLDHNLKQAIDGATAGIESYLASKG